MQLKRKVFWAGLAVAAGLLAGCSSVDLNPNGPDANAGADPFTNPASPLSQQSIYFAFDSYSVPAESQAMIEAHAQYLATHPTATVVLEGNTDARGGREYNLALGERRAVAVKNYLISRGVDAERIKTISYGKERPAVLGNNEAAWAQNRRAVTVVKAGN